MIVTTTQIADIFGVSRKTVADWAKRGMPKHAYGKFDLSITIQWWADNMYRAEDDDTDIKDAKEAYWIAKSRTETVKADLAEEKVMPIEDFKKAWAWRVSEVFSGILGWSMRLSPLLAKKTDKEIQSIIYNEAWALCDKFSRTGKFTPAVKKPVRKKK
jgi:hypothetical protein